MLVFTASETLFMISMALCYFYSWQTYSVDLTKDQVINPRNRDVIVAVHINEVANALYKKISYCFEWLAGSIIFQIIGILF